MRLVPGVLLILAGAAPSTAAVSDRFTRTIPLTPGTPISLRVTIGQVNITGWERPDVAVDIVRRAPDADRLALAPAEVATTPEGVSIRAVQGNEGRDASIRTDVALRVPSSAHLADVEVFEGRVDIAGLTGRTSARVERGDIVAEDVAGTIRLETAIGNIRITRARLDPQGLIRARTFNGNVNVSFARRPEHARLLALALNGTITSDVPLNRQERWGPRWGEATIGNGEPVVSIDVVNGNIDLKLMH